MIITSQQEAKFNARQKAISDEYDARMARARARYAETVRPAEQAFHDAATVAREEAHTATTALLAEFGIDYA